MGQTVSVEDRLREIVPRLTTAMHKGQCGRVAIFGGSDLYTGAPYFAGIAALRTGVDLVHVFCTESAAGPLKSYSPELIVHPFFQEDYEDPVEACVKRCHAVVVGPGLGLEEQVQSVMRSVFPSLCALGIPVVVDAVRRPRR